MARKPKSPDVRPIPDKAAILAFIARTPGKVGKREIAREFGLNPPAKLALKRLLKEMEATGDLRRERRAVAPTGATSSTALPPVIVADIVRRDADGDLIAEPMEWNGTSETMPIIRILTPRRAAREEAPVAGVSDRVLIRLSETGEDGDVAYEGKVIKILTKPVKRALGVFRAAPEGGGRIIPVEKRGQAREILIPPGTAMGDAADGDLVAVELSRDSRLSLRTGRVRERLGSTTSERAISLIAIHTHEIPHIFSAAALKEAEAAKNATLKGREDWRNIPLITIDPADAKDHDDAVCAEYDDDPANPGGFILHIAIADVAAYVRPGTALDREALERGNSVYFPDHVVPMLPERISNDLCSLKPGVDRAALGLRVVLSARGEKKVHSFHRVLINSAAKLSYPEAQARVDAQSDDPLTRNVLVPLYGAYEALKIARDARGPLDLDLPERKLVLDETGHVTNVIVPERLDAHRLIEEFMILANVAAAETLEKARMPLLYRTHDAPSLEKMQGLRDFLDTIGIILPKQGVMRPEMFNRILARTLDSPHKALLNEVILRSQAQAEYSPENIGHFGLNLRRYAHFTSPIRRYADLLVHRGLIRALGLAETGKGGDGLPPEITFEVMKEIGTKISAAERRAMAAERETVDRLIAHYLADQVGASFNARICGVTRVGLFVKLETSGADGFIPAATLGTDFYRYDETAHALTGQRTGESYRLGDGVKVRLMEAAPMAGALRFEMLSEGRYVKVARSKHRPRPGLEEEGGFTKRGQFRAHKPGAAKGRGKRG